METKTLILGAVVILLALLGLAQYVDKGVMLSEKHELELNASRDEGWDYGYTWGVYDTFEETLRNGVYVMNETWILYSPEGCGAAFMAELENEGCEVVCAGP